MTHAALTPLVGREFDDFLFASIGDDRNGPLLSVLSALARLDVDPWQEAVDLARMPRKEAIERLSSLIASLPKGATASLSPEVVAARLIALLPRTSGFNAPAAASKVLIAKTLGWRSFIGVGVLAFLLVAYFVYTARASNAPTGKTDARAATSEPAARRSR